MKRLAIAFALAMSLCGVGVVTGGAQGQGQNHGQGNQGQGGPPPVAEPPMGGIQWARGQAGPSGGGSPQLVYHTGPVMTAGAYVEPIFWGPRWSDTSFAADKKAGIQTFYEGMNQSPYEATNTEYTQTGDTHVGTTVTFGSSHVDLSDAVKNGSRTSPILAEVCSQVGNNVRTNGYYPVYIDQPRGHAGYCAWHSAGTCSNGTTIQFAFFFNLDGDAGCDPDDTSGLHSQGLAALANVSGHELSEALTDPRLNAWYDASGAENSDKCAWVFGTPLLSFTNGSQWKVQGNWSNVAFSAGKGFANRDGQKGCLDGGNYK
jgi:hypothetical protein